MFQSKEEEVKTFALTYRNFEHGADGVDILFVNAPTLLKATELAIEFDLKYMDAGTHPLLSHEVYEDNTVVGRVELVEDLD